MLLTKTLQVLAHKLARAREDRMNHKDFPIPITAILEESKGSNQINT
jgi:hypothetical protein